MSNIKLLIFSPSTFTVCKVIKQHSSLHNLMLLSQHKATRMLGYHSKTIHQYKTCHIVPNELNHPKCYMLPRIGLPQPQYQDNIQLLRLQI